MRRFDPAVSAKTATTTVSGAAVLVLVYVAGLFGLDVPADVAAAAVLLAMAGVAYFMPARRPGKYEATDD